VLLPTNRIRRDVSVVRAYALGVEELGYKTSSLTTTSSERIGSAQGLGGPYNVHTTFTSRSCFSATSPPSPRWSW